MKNGIHYTNRVRASAEARQAAIRMNPASILWTPWNDTAEIAWGMDKFSQARHIYRLPNDDYWKVETISYLYALGIYTFQFGNEPAKEFEGPELWNWRIRGFFDELNPSERWPDAVWLYSPMPVGPEWDEKNLAYWTDAADILARPNVQIGAHAYWQYPDGLTDPMWGWHWQRVHEMYSDKDIYLTEVGNTHPLEPKEEKARQYVRYATLVPDFIKAICILGLDPR